MGARWSALLGLKPFSSENARRERGEALGGERSWRNLGRRILRVRDGLCMVLIVVLGIRRSVGNEKYSYKL
jgi:hypothetical protein